MIIINGNKTDAQALSQRYMRQSLEAKCIYAMSKSSTSYAFSSEDELQFELALRSAIVSRSARLLRSGLQFEVFRDTYCNEKYWLRNRDGGFTLKRGASASVAVQDMFTNGKAYGTECATAMQIVYYGALLDIVPRDKFDKQFKGISLMNWHNIAPELRETGNMQRASDYFYGDRRYFANPDVNPRTPEWQGENVIDMGDGTYYGHGIGRTTGDVIIRELNENRRPGASRGSYLMDSAGRPAFKKLFRVFGAARQDRF